MKLNDYIERYAKTSVNKQLLASELGISLTSLYAYAQGKRTPTITLADKIEKATKGQVTINDLLLEHKEINHGLQKTSEETSS